jgi:hypothetical protein
MQKEKNEGKKTWLEKKGGKRQKKLARKHKEEKTPKNWLEEKDKRIG